MTDEPAPRRPFRDLAHELLPDNPERADAAADRVQAMQDAREGPWADDDEPEPERDR